MARWTEQDIPDLGGKTAVVTGANSGLGLATAQALAARGAHVVLTCRSSAKGEAAIAAIRSAVPSAELDCIDMDLSQLSSVRRAAGTLKGQHRRIDILVNNAGIMGLPLTRTADGFELLFGTNHLGHFAFAGLIFDLLRAAPAARIVSVASLAHHTGRMRIDDLNWERRRYSKAGAYAQSKLANLMFALELDRRLRIAGIDALSLAAHPGYAATNIFFGGVAAQPSLLRSAWNRAAKLGAAVFAQPAELGALPILFAASAPQAQSGSYYGPRGPAEVRGYPGKAWISAQARDPILAAELWQASERLTGVRWPL